MLSELVVLYVMPSHVGQFLSSLFIDMELDCYHHLSIFTSNSIYMTNVMRKPIYAICL